MDCRVRTGEKNSSNSLTVSLCLCLVFLALLACRTATPATVEERAQAINKSLMCPVCPAENIDQSQVDLARQMRAIVLEKLENGWDDTQIVQFFVDRYGEQVRMEPTKSGINLLAWLIPPFGFMTGVAVLVLVLRSMIKGRQFSGDDKLMNDDTLLPYLSQIDEEMDSMNCSTGLGSSFAVADGKEEDRSDG